METNDIILSIIVPTYNQEKYIEKAIYSILEQKIDFNYEVLIGEDASTDNTAEILKSLEKILPNNFYIFYRKKNMGCRNNGEDLLNKARGKYIIALEGDDYWIYRYKIKTQVEFLEKNPEYIATAHNVIVVDKNGNIRNDYRCAECKKEEYTLYDFQEGILMGQTASVLYRNYRKFNLLTDLHISVDYPPDQKLNFLLVCNGKIRCFQEKWSAYRYVTDEGSSFSATQKYNKNRFINRINFLKEIKCYAFNKANNIDAQKATETKFLIALLYLIVTNKINYNLFYFFKEFYKAKYKINFIRALCRRVKKLKHNGR